MINREYFAKSRAYADRHLCRKTFVFFVSSVFGEVWVRPFPLLEASSCFHTCSRLRSLVSCLHLQTRSKDTSKGTATAGFYQFGVAAAASRCPCIDPRRLHDIAATTVLLLLLLLLATSALIMTVMAT